MSVSVSTNYEYHRIRNFYTKKESVLNIKVYTNRDTIHSVITYATFKQLEISLHDNLYSIVLKTNSVNVFSDTDYIINSLRDTITIVYQFR